MAKSFSSFSFIDVVVFAVRRLDLSRAILAAIQLSVDTPRPPPLVYLILERRAALFFIRRPIKSEIVSKTLRAACPRLLPSAIDRRLGARLDDFRIYIRDLYPAGPRGDVRGTCYYIYLFAPF